MCTMISTQTAIAGSGKSTAGWFPVTQANVGFDHASGSEFEHALLLDFVNPELGANARVALEINIASGKALLATLAEVIARAEASGAPE